MDVEPKFEWDADSVKRRERAVKRAKIASANLFQTSPTDQAAGSLSEGAGGIWSAQHCKRCGTTRCGRFVFRNFRASLVITDIFYAVSWSCLQGLVVVLAGIGHQHVMMKPSHAVHSETLSLCTTCKASTASSKGSWGAKLQGWVTGHLVTRIVDSVQVEVQAVHVRYEVRLTHLREAPCLPFRPLQYTEQTHW